MDNAPIAEELKRYLQTGETDPLYRAWPGSVLERADQGSRELRQGLIAEVRRLAVGRSHLPLPPGNICELTRRKVTPMVRGLFPKKEHEAVLAVLERSVTFITNENFERVLTEHDWAGSAWDLANLYLATVGAPLLVESAPNIVGLNEHTTCYVSPEYFRETDSFSDFIVHEAAHIFHNCKRRTVGLREVRGREWLLDIDIRKREEFAYSCEAYARILERAGTLAKRSELADQFAEETDIADTRFDAAEVTAIVRSAVTARNGWKIIFARCALVIRPEKRRANPSPTKDIDASAPPP
jgi:hypothetical protein